MRPVRDFRPQQLYGVPNGAIKANGFIATIRTFSRRWI